MQVDLTSGLAYEQAYYAQVCDLTFHIASSYTHTHACTHTCMRTHTQICTHAQPFYGFLDSVRDNTGELAPEETFTHSHLSWSSVIPCLLPPSFTIHSILLVQFMCLTPQSLSKFSLVYLLAWHPQLHTPYISSLNHCLLGEQKTFYMTYSLYASTEFVMHLRTVLYLMVDCQMNLG